MDKKTEILEKFYNEENISYFREQVKIDIILLENLLKEKFTENELLLFIKLQNKWLELKKAEELDLIEFALKEFMNSNKN